MLIGITERGDAGLNLAWLPKMNDVDGAILITKSPHLIKFQEAVEQVQNKVIVHCTITGFGGSMVEPNVPTPYVAIEGFRTLLDMLGPNRVVLRIDPIIPTDRGLKTLHNMLDLIEDFHHDYSIPKIRVRFSFIDNYRHLKTNGMVLPWQSFNPPYENAKRGYELLLNRGFILESCAEDYDFIPQSIRVGCVSSKDYNALGLQFKAEPLKGQRSTCLCVGSKTELLQTPYRCPHHCLYCYWKGGTV